MKPLKSLIFAGLFAGLSVNFASADDIVDVVMVSEDTVEISGTLTGCAERAITSSAFCDNMLYTIQLDAEPQPDDEEESCSLATNAFSLNFTLPEDNHVTDILAQLFVFDENGEPLITDDFELALEEITEDTCADECTVDFAECNEACTTGAATCVEECADDQDCIAACSDEQCYTDCQTANDGCMATCVEPQTALTTCTPATLNLKSNGRWITCLMQSDDMIAVEEVDLELFMLNGNIPADRVYLQDDLLTLKFSRQDLIQSLLPEDDEELEVPMETELVVTGALIDGTPIEGTDTITVIFPQPKEKQVKSQKEIQKKVQSKKSNKKEKKEKKGKK